MRRGKIEGGPGAALHAECGVFCVRAHWLREAIVRQVRRGRTGRYWRLCFRRRRRRMARCCRPFKPSLPLRSGYFPKSGKRRAETSLSRIVRRRWGSHFFSGSRKPAGFSRRGAQVGENALPAFSEQAAVAFPSRAFLSRDKDWSFRDGGRLGGFCARFSGRFPRNGARTGKIIR